jgi:hypothetical protein
LNVFNEHVYFWDHNWEYDDTLDEDEVGYAESHLTYTDNCFLIATSFSEFFNEKLYQYVDED